MKLHSLNSFLFRRLLKMDPRLRGDDSASFTKQRLEKLNGFTLIEILIVMVIISIISAVAVLSIRFNQNKQLENLANQIVSLISLSEEEAILRPATIGLALGPDSFQFYEYQETKKTWLALKDSNFSQHSYPTNTEISVQVQGKKIEINNTPQIIISPSGDLSPFIILIGKKNADPIYRVIGKANGDVKSGYVNEE